MVINSNLSAAQPQPAKTAPAKPATPPTVTNASAVVTDFSLGPDIATPDEAGQSVASAVNSILQQPNLAQLAQANHSPDTVLALLQP